MHIYYTAFVEGPDARIPPHDISCPLEKAVRQEGVHFHAHIVLHA